MKPTLLIVDDDTDLLESLSSALADPEWEIVTASTVEEAKEYVLAKEIGFVITDMCMTGKNDRDGLTLLDWIRTIKPSVEVAVITGFGDIASERLTRIWGGIRFFHKPVDPSILHNLARRVLTGRVPAATEQPDQGRMDDAEAARLKRRYLEGDDDALNEILDGYRPVIFSICTGWYSFSNEETEDVIQEIGMDILLKISRVKNLRSYIIGTAMNLCRRRCAKPRGDSLPPVDEDLPGEDVDLIRRLEAREVLDLLNPFEKRLMEMLFFEGRSYAETAEELGISVGSIGPTRMRVLSKARTLLGREGRKGGG